MTALTIAVIIRIPDVDVQSMMHYTIYISHGFS